MNKNIGELKMTNNLTTLIQSYVNGDGGETLSKSYEDRLNDVFLILMKDFTSNYFINNFSITILNIE